MKRLIGLAIACGSAALAPAEEAKVRLEPSSMELPRRIGPLTLRGEPHKYDDPALGVSYQYGADGLSLTVYVYDGGITAIADGADTNPVCREFEFAKQGIAQAYQNAELRSESLVSMTAGAAPLVREARFEYQREQQPTISYVWITAAAGKFLKLRFSADPRLRDELPQARQALLAAVDAALASHVEPLDASGAKAATSMALSFSMGASADDMATGLLYLGILTVIAEQAPQSAPVCGGEYVPGFAQELGAWRAVFAMDDAKPKSKFGKTVAAVEKAGFLEEFVWSEFHRPEWGTQPPENLAPTEYQSWRRKHLKRFKRPQFGSVIFAKPRPLPIEPL